MRARLDSAAPDLVVAFVSAHHESEYRLLPSLVRDALGDGHLLGCSAGGVIGGGRELEEQPGLSLTAAVLPGVTMSTVPSRASRRSPALARDAAPSFVLIPDPFTFDADELPAPPRRWLAGLAP